MADSQTQMRKGAMELSVLALLRDADALGGRYGGELVDLLAGLPGLDAGAGTIYPVLSRLHSGGLLATSWHESPYGPPRKYYRLTASGHRALEQQSRAWNQLAATMATLLDPAPSSPGADSRRPASIDVAPARQGPRGHIGTDHVATDQSATDESGKQR